ncbi:chaperonin containing t-complex protein 1, eta subunit, putative [Theileria equi strain WA]|uniref:T-complex protein 1 subunit eta n=1 Tax=Theileria equi strain WA TaxID=1537102 RepID=L1LBE6_THEEQ|nr:chaperonin containing t-complex protein 1, eta subunit, putative [Theileria equi strain WA]EKX72595.1 chaperonin containing t-complex protein 1, eta subunit, putative [Theileria equi strain WA]|eukprot:XP_004832047.1 chaperonin containing t-complex protein 1, eta subunit, putative [Theileria equi strain WA]
MSHLMNLPILLLKEGTDTSQGRAQIISNINACQVIVNCVKTTLGPRGMDKLIHTENDVTITNDGATVLNLLDVAHPAASVLVDIAKSQDDEVGDGTTSVTVLAGELLSEAKTFVADGMSPQMIIKYFRQACDMALKTIDNISINLSNKSQQEKTSLLLKCAETTLTSKLVSGHKEFFAKMVVDAVSLLDTDLDQDLIGIKKVTGGSCTDSLLVKGVAFKKTFSYAGAEQQPKKFEKPKILLLNLELELKAEKENAEILITNPEEYQSIVDAEWSIINEKLEKIANLGANVVLSKLPIGDIATQFFASKNIFCAGRVEQSDLLRTSKATGAAIQTTVNGVCADVLGTCGVFEEVQIGGERFNLFKDCEHSKTSTIILRGGAQQFIDESERSLHDAIMIVRRAMKSNSIVGGGGAIEMELSKVLREYSLSIVGKQQIIINAFARALECIPRNLAINSGFNPTDLLSKLRREHAKTKGDPVWFGIDCIRGGICDSYLECIWEPSVVKKNVVYSATEAACLVLSIDETVKHNKQAGMNSALPGQN